ncbi:low molecular weight protein-tyrosine-phosphatase [Allohahella sp. A8]|uniref:low molecular weight protein-tyrosine-phosphatase n=1 Tax=Allohahella sp. A8 TaxID=3141461 RepID=UPI003A80DF55
MMNILFVCLGNICRSPSAEAVFRGLVQKQGLQQHYRLDSAGTGDWHVGKAPDPRAIEAAGKRELDLSELRARQLSAEDFQAFDAIVVMDDQNFEDVMNICPSQSLGKISKLSDYARNPDVRAIDDPYYGDDQGFDRMLDNLEDACAGLLERLEVRRQALEDRG